MRAVNKHSTYTRRPSERSHRRRRVSISKIFAALIIFAVIVSAGITLKAFVSSASEGDNPDRVICYKQIDVEYGDSVWSIASENLPDDYTDVQSYVNEILSINNFPSDIKLAEGSQIIIPYYHTVTASTLK